MTAHTGSATLRSSGGTRPHTRLRMASLAAALALLGGLSFTRPERWMDLTETGWLQQLQALCLGVTLILVLWGALGHRGEGRIFWLFLGFPCFFLFWRELDLDRETAWIGHRAFSWSYLDDRRVPLATRLLLFLPSAGMTAAWAGLILLNPRRLARGVQQSVNRSTVLLGAGALLAMGLAQAWDLSLIPHQHPDPYLEEALELAGEVALLLLVLELGALPWLRPLRRKPVL